MASNEKLPAIDQETVNDDLRKKIRSKYKHMNKMCEELKGTELEIAYPMLNSALRRDIRTAGFAPLIKLCIALDLDPVELFYGRVKERTHPEEQKKDEPSSDKSSASAPVAHSEEQKKDYPSPDKSDASNPVAVEDYLADVNKKRTNNKGTFDQRFSSAWSMAAALQIPAEERNGFIETYLTFYDGWLGEEDGNPFE